MSARAIELPTKYRITKYRSRSRDRTVNYMRNHMGTIGASRDHLYYAIYDGPNMQIWFLEDHSLKVGSHWILKHTLCTNRSAEDPLAEFIFLAHLCNYPFIPYAFHPTSEVLFLGIPELIGTYDLESNKLEKVFEPKLGARLVCPLYNIHPYSRCLVSLKDCLASRHRPHGSIQSTKT
ncbi:hypothetical protein HS088_TW05G00202 [Tripterygium wilfordii]|uniref:F-box protein n=2 Tax=Tripterygium wilfordii TaxID=458696 RepID=A0A7J7DMC4_TRIWF|nr:hypothetical protein HS088_TW05G00202 [Tripterygium wilfordii]